MAKLREIAESDGFGKKATDLFKTCERADEALNGAMFALARQPDLSRYPLIDATSQGPLRAFKTKILPTSPSCVIYFTEDDDGQRVVLHDIIKAKPSEEI